MKHLLIIFLWLWLSVPALAGEAGRFGLGVNFAWVSNLRVWNSASAEDGNLIRVDYSYDFNDFYTAALEIGFYADEHVFKRSAAATFPQTATMLNINHIFHTAAVGPFSPYFKVGTGIYSVDLWERIDDRFYFLATAIMADLSAGVGAEFKVWNVPVNVDLSIPGLVRELIFAKKMPLILSLGGKWYF